MRAVALGLVVAAASTSAVTACDSQTDATASTLDPGPTFGVEVTVNVVGNGRVVSTPAGIDCPATCFARITSAEHDFDGADLGLTLGVTPGLGSHFVGWTAQPLVSGTRARGPAECSPMTRNALGPPIGSTEDAIVLPYGETQGTPPKGREAMCAEYTTVPVAYALVATFAEDPGQPSFGQDAAAPGEVLFEPPALGSIVAREIAVIGDTIYFRYDQDGVSSAIVMGPKNGKGGLAFAIAPSGSPFRTVAMGPNIVVQQQNLVFQTFHTTTLQRATQTSLGVNCTGITTDNTSAYCRFASGSQSFLYTWTLDGSSSLRYVYTLPFGSDLAVDDANVYFTDVPFGSTGGLATLETAAKAPDASGFPDASKLVSGLNNPTRLLLTPNEFLWVDTDKGNEPTLVGYASRDGGNPVLSSPVGGTVTGLVADPMDPKLFYGASTSTFGTSIYRYSVEQGFFDRVLSGMESVNGLAVDDTYVYWTQNDGRVYRTSKELR